jgi:N-methylhydantoinase A
LIMQVNGGCASVQEVLERPVYALASGPAAAPAAATFHTGRLGLNDLITCDMGGTSFDVCVVRDGRPALSRGVRVQDQPIGVAAVEVRSVGAGGGSIAWVDSGGALQVGPRSAGARPGPACYGAGGQEPTVTDANVVLGYLAPDAFLGGRRQLDVDAARDAIDRFIARPLGLDVQRAAAGVIRVVNANMAGALRAVSIERGVDPRGFSLVVGGGAGGLHAGELAAQLGMTTVVIPDEAGTFCAFGMTVTDVRHDFVRAYHTLSSEIDLQRVEALFNSLEHEGSARLAQAGFQDDGVLLERWVDARYPGQVHELTIPVRREDGADTLDLGALEHEFHEEHATRFTYSRTDMPVEFLHWRVVAMGRISGTGGAGRSHGAPRRHVLTPTPVELRTVHFGSSASETAVPVYAASTLSAGARVQGPAIIQAETTTILVNPRDALTVGPGAYVMAVGAADPAREVEVVGG